jgi:hypothetical protein
VGLQDSGSNNPLFRDLDTLRNAEGMKAVISQRISNGMITFSIVREFQRDGRMQSTAFIPVDQIDALIELVEIVRKRCDELQADPKVMDVVAKAQSAKSAKAVNAKR